MLEDCGIPRRGPKAGDVALECDGVAERGGLDTRDGWNPDT